MGRVSGAQMIDTKARKERQETLTVVIPCFNTHAYLDQTILSVRSQTFPDIEIIVVDDGSTNSETIAFLDSLGGDVKLIRQENRGLPAARNAGFAAAKGDFILPLDADDWLEPSCAAKLIELLVRHPDLAFAFSYMRMEGEGRGVLAKEYNFFEQLFLNQLPYCMMLRKEAWSGIGGYDESMRRGYEDWEFNIRLGRSGHFGAVVPEPLFHYRIAQTGMLLSTSSIIHGELWEIIRRKHAKLYEFYSLFELWRRWYHHKSTYPLWLYPLWLVAAKILPQKSFGAIFRFLRRFSLGRRITAASKPN